jgi:HPt (histidine-containing phosphotransfer) domain-containing protein
LAGEAGEKMCTDKRERVLNLDVALAHVDGDRQLLAELSAMFLQDYPRLLVEVKSSIENGNCSDLERAAHTLRGRLAFFGIQEVRERALELERIGRLKDLNGAWQALAEVERQIESILPEFESLSRGQGA